jgi:hypothetical protein
VYTALERNRQYRIGIGDEARLVTFREREFPEDHPPVFTFLDHESGELVHFMLEQLTEIEKQGGIRYLGTTLTPDRE